MSDYNHHYKFKLLIIVASYFGLSFFLPEQLFLANAQSHSMDSSNHNHNHSDSAEIQENHHHHKTIEIPSDSDIPTVQIIAYPDTVEGWNLQIKTTNFDFAPESVNKDSNFDQGHAHLFINGQKVTRIYSNWHYISELPQGENEIKVTLNTNQHEDLAYQGKIIEDTIIINNK